LVGILLKIITKSLYQKKEVVIPSYE